MYLRELMSDYLIYYIQENGVEYNHPQRLGLYGCVMSVSWIKHFGASFQTHNLFSVLESQTPAQQQQSSWQTFWNN